MRASMRGLLVVFVFSATAVPALAQEPPGCDKFKWPLDKERATLTGTDLPKLASGSRVGWPLPFATTVTLLPFTEVKLPVAPERAPKSNKAFAGFIEVPAPVQGGGRRKSIAATGATGCDGVRKSVKFELAKAPFTVQFSGIEASSVGVVISGE